MDMVNRKRGGLEGLLIGDAFGVPYEFHAPESLPPIHHLAFDPPQGFARAHGLVPPGTWSDDGAQALCLLESLQAKERMDAHDFAERLVRWYRDGHLAVDGVVFDVGIGTRAALDAIARGRDALAAARTDERANGNGALMRVLPLALWHRGSDEDLVEDAHLQTRVTHGHARSWVCSALYSLWARRELHDEPHAYEGAVAQLRRIYDGDLRRELEEHVAPDAPAQGRGTGYVVDCLHSARWALSDASCYEEVVRRAVSLGRDTDTTAAVAGGIAGLRFGVDDIPDDWRETLRGRELFETMLCQLVSR